MSSSSSTGLLGSIFITNRAGGLIYHKDFNPIAKLTGNDRLRFASTFHGLNAIANQISPVFNAGGIESLVTEKFQLQSYETPTGIKFFLIAYPHAPDLEELLQKVYITYTDYVLKNPFYKLEMPIRIELFDTHIQQLVDLYNNDLVKKGMIRNYPPSP